jgi:PAS domain S-box-containing protein
MTETGEPHDQSEETKKALHDLRVHQIELEIQNEELRRVQAELEAERSRYFELFDLAPVGYVSVGVDGLVLEANLAAVRTFGLDRSEMVGHMFSRFILKEDQDIYFLNRKLLLETGKTQVFEQRMVKKDGSVFWAHLESVAAMDRAGNILCRIALGDIGERRRNEERIQRNDTRLRRLVDILQHPAHNVQVFLDHALNQAIQLTGSAIGYIYYYHEDSQEFILNSWSKDVMAECAVANPQSCYALDKTGFWGEAVRQRRPIVANDFQAAHPLKKGYPEGHIPLFRFITIPVFKNDGIVGVVGLANKMTDYDDEDILEVSLLMESVWKVTEQKIAEDEREKALEENRRLLAELQHRVKNSFSLITSMISLSSGSVGSDDGKEALDDLAARVRAVAELYTLLYSAGSPSVVRLDTYCTRAAALIVGIVDRISLVTETDEISISVKKAAPIGLILTELITNAVKYAFPGGRWGTVSVSLKKTEAGARMEVRDDGVGLPPHFDLSGSAGMGLTLVDALSTQIGGSFRMERADVGTRGVVDFIMAGDSAD